MKTTLDRLLLSLAMAGVVGLARGGEPPNVLKNPSFEEEAKVNMAKAAGELIDRGIDLPSGEAAIMPAHVYVNPADGWQLASQEACFEYVTGKAGEGVHTGKHAIHIVSPRVRVGTSVGGSIEVVEGVGLDESAININKVCPLSFHAKGQGTITIGAYLYDRKGVNIQDSASGEVRPSIIKIDDDTKWIKYEGTLKIMNPDVAKISFVLCVQGDMVIDDVVLSPAD